MGFARARQGLRQNRLAPYIDPWAPDVPHSLANASMPLTPQGEKVEKGTKSRYENRYEGYEGNWSTEYRTHEYPEDSKGLHHHPEYSEQWQEEKKEEKAPVKSGSAGLIGGCLIWVSACAANVL